MSDPSVGPHGETWNIAAFVRRLEQLAPSPGGRDDPVARAKRAALRRGLGKSPGEAPEVLPVLIPLLSGATTAQEQTIAFAIGPLFAAYPRPYEPGSLPGPRSDFGASVRALDRALRHRARDAEGAERASSEESRHTALERRFVVILDSAFDDLPVRLRSFVRMFAANDVPVDWLQLTRDLARWDDRHRRVQLNWANSFWREEPAREQAADDEADDAEEMEVA